MNLASVLLEPATSAPDALALRDGESVTTYGELADAAARFASRVRAEAIAPDDRVAIASVNDTQFVVAYLGVLAAGAVAVPLNPAAPRPEIAAQLADVEPALVVCGPGASPDVSAQAEAMGIAVLTIELDELASHEPASIAHRVDGDLAVLLFTAGTAGAPKAAMLTHGNLVANIRAVLGHPGLRMGSSDVGLALLPFFHVYGLNVALGVALAAGAESVLVPEFRPAASLELVRRHHVTVIAGVPTMFAAWLALPEAEAPADSFASVRLAVSGAAALSGETAAAMLERFGVVVHEGYGLTEASPIVTTSAVDGDLRLGSVGPPLPGVDVRLVDVDGSDALAGDSGEIWVRGPSVFAGYWRDAQATARVLTPDGWLRTGDVAVADADGYLHLVDRTKDLIIVSGFNVFPAEVEDVLRSHPAVTDVGVIGVPSERTGEAIAAYVVPRAGHDLAATDLDEWCASRLARYKQPASIEVVDELPRSVAGKLLRRVLRADEPDATRNPA